MRQLWNGGVHEGVRGVRIILVSAVVAIVVSMAVTKATFCRIDRYVAETTTALQEAAKRLEKKVNGGRHV